jgi:predicted MFS family arabinose efflux permease
MAMEFGIFLGAFVSGWIYGNSPSRFLLCFAICAALALMAVMFLLNKRRQPATIPATDEIELN